MYVLHSSLHNIIFSYSLRHISYDCYHIDFQDSQSDESDIAVNATVDNNDDDHGPDITNLVLIDDDNDLIAADTAIVALDVDTAIVAIGADTAFVALGADTAFVALDAKTAVVAVDIEPIYILDGIRSLHIHIRAYSFSLSLSFTHFNNLPTYIRT